METAQSIGSSGSGSVAQSPCHSVTMSSVCPMCGQKMEDTILGHMTIVEVCNRWQKIDYDGNCGNDLMELHHLRCGCDDFEYCVNLEPHIPQEESDLEHKMYTAYSGF